LSASLCATEFERHESALRHGMESSEAVLARHVATLQHGMDVGDLMSEHKVLVRVFCQVFSDFITSCWFSN